MANYSSNRGRGRQCTTRSLFGRKLRSLRMAKGLTQWDLAGLTGVHYSYIGKIESAAGRGPSRALIGKLAQVLGGDRDELLALAGKGDPEMDALKQMLREARQEIRGLREQLEAKDQAG